MVREQIFAHPIILLLTDGRAYDIIYVQNECSIWRNEVMAMFRCELSEMERHLANGEYQFEYTDNVINDLFIKVDGFEKFFDSYIIVRWPDTIVFQSRNGSRVVISCVEYVDLDIANGRTDMVFCCGGSGKIIRKYGFSARKVK